MADAATKPARKRHPAQPKPSERDPLKLVIYGPPGAGKSVLAKHLANALARDPILTGTPGMDEPKPLQVDFYTTNIAADFSDPSAFERERGPDYERYAQRQATTSPDEPFTCADAARLLAERFPVGAEVQLTCGGPTMTVLETDTRWVTVCWLCPQQHFHTEELPAATLRLALDIPF